MNTARCYFKGKQNCQWPLLQGCQHTAHFDLKWSGPVKLHFCQCKEVTTTTVFLPDKEKAAVAKTIFWFGIISICFSIMSSVADAWEHIHIK